MDKSKQHQQMMAERIRADRAAVGTTYDRQFPDRGVFERMARQVEGADNRTISGDDRDVFAKRGA